MAEDEIGPRSDRMEGEPSAAKSREQAEYWGRSYRQVIAFEERILERMHELARRETEEIQAEIVKTNIKPMEQLIADFKRRARRWEIGGHLGQPTDEESGS